MSNASVLLRGRSRWRDLLNAQHSVQHARHLTTFESGQTANPGLQHKPQPTELSEDGARSLRVRKYGGKSLPLPPFMDPVKVARHMKYRTPKAPENAILPDQMTELQKELAMNPYGTHST